MIRNPLSRLLLSGLLTGLTDGCFACVQSVFFYDSTVTRLWQGVASVLLGKEALEGGTRTALIGVLMHFGVAFAWSAVFLLLAQRSAWIRRVLGSRFGALKIASWYGPLVWSVMSLVVIPVLAHRPPSVSLRWLYQLIGHIPFVGLPIAWSIGTGVAREGRPA